MTHLFSALLLSLATAGAPGAEPNAAAPDFALKSLDGVNLRLSEFRGEVVLLNFWATWCGTCRQEMPALERIHALYEPAGLRLIGVNIDEDARRVAQMARGLDVNYPILLDAGREVSREYEVEEMPVTVLIDRSGVIRQVYRDYRPGNEESYIEELRKLLGE